MCDDCPTCPECGQTVPEPPTFSYMVGLAVGPILVMVLGIVVFYFDLISPLLYGAIIGMMGMGVVILFKTDPHIRRHYLSDNAP